MTDFWRGKRVVVTGGAGMVGASLVQRLLFAGARVSVLDDFSRGQTQIDGARYVRADANDTDTCLAVFDDADAVFNLAAFVAGVSYNHSHQVSMHVANARLQSAPIGAAMRLDVPHFLQVSSVCVYGNDAQDPCIETNLGGEPNGANAGYAWAKRMGERAALWANLQHCVIVRPANLYGVRDYFDERAHVIPALIRKCVSDDVIRVESTGNEVREFLYADDAASGMMHALEHGEPNGIYNIGTNGETAVTIRELVEMIQDATNTKHKPVTFTSRALGDSRRIVNADKLRALGWTHRVGLREGIKAVCEWYTPLA